MSEENRYYDDNNHLIVKRTVISKADVNPYYGREIPRNKELGLDPNRVYNLLRDPEELRKAMPTFSAMQLLMQHTPVDATNPEKDLTIGALGSEFEMDEEGRLIGLIRVHDQEGIDYIESGKMEQLSAGYAYTADMTSGEYNGVQYDGIMRDIHGNHVALVERGRIGSDAIIADEMPNDIEDYLMSKQIALKKGALTELKAKLGMDSDEQVKKHIVAIHDALALDEDDKEEKAEDEVDIVEKDDVAEDEDDGPKADKERKELEKTDKDDRDAKAEDEDLEPRGAKVAQDAAISARNQVVGMLSALREVEPLVGALAMDGFNTAKDVYSYALKAKGVQTKGINEAGLKAMVGMQLNSKPQQAMDSSLVKATGTFSDKLKRFK